MFNNLKTKVACAILVGVFLILTNTASAGSTFIQGGHSGGWVDPDSGGHGLFVEVIVSETSPTGLAVVVAWYAYVNGQQTWIIGIGNVVQDDLEQVANINAFVYEGNDFPPQYDPDQTMEIPWGTMTLEFEGCENAVLNYSSTIDGYGSGMIDLERFTTIAGSNCDPNLGEDTSEPDDHGDFWQTATAFNSPNVPAFQDKEIGRIDYPGDIDVFTFVIHKNSDVTVFSEGEYGPMGTIYEIDTNVETVIVSDDDSGVGENFHIETTLDPGTYSLHVRRSTLTSESTGRYLLTLIITQN